MWPSCWLGCGNTRFMPNFLFKFICTFIFPISVAKIFSNIIFPCRRKTENVNKIVSKLCSSQTHMHNIHTWWVALEIKDLFQLWGGGVNFPKSSVLGSKPPSPPFVSVLSLRSFGEETSKFHSPFQNIKWLTFVSGI